VKPLKPAEKPEKIKIESKSAKIIPIKSLEKPKTTEKPGPEPKIDEHLQDFA
jgi:hypothetical protein